MILPWQTIGILGGGQLGRMFAIAARRMGYHVHALDPTPESPTGQVADYEISAQEAVRLPNARTFAANSDIHAQPVPPGSFDENYSPGAVPPEMPTTISGSRADRMEQAHAYRTRAEAVLAKTRKGDHHPSLPYRQLGAFMTELRACGGTAARALEFTILCGTRTGDVIGSNRDEKPPMKWPHVDLDGRPGRSGRAAETETTP